MTFSPVSYKAGQSVNYSPGKALLEEWRLAHFVFYDRLEIEDLAQTLHIYALWFQKDGLALYNMRLKGDGPMHTF